ncbi:MAG: anti-sigma factor [Sphingomicrobium sp.]
MDEKFFAWLDGELDDRAAAEMEARVAADPELAKAAEEHRAFAHKLRAAFDPIASDAVPERLRQAIRRPAAVTDLSNWRERKQRPPARRALPQWAAIAATLAVGVFVGMQLNDPAKSPVELHDGQMIAASALDRALDKQLASASQNDVRIGLTFRDSSGDICRSFTTAVSSGLACRNGEDWQVKGMFAAPEGQQAGYRMAGGEDPNLATLIDSTIEGEPFDADHEAQARAKDWR